MSESETKHDRLARAADAFSPAAPVNDEMLFADRPEQVSDCIEALFQRGQHIALYGERGVGKTSLAIMLPKLVKGVESEFLDAARVDCNSSDSFQTIWRKVFRELGTPLSDDDLAQLEPEDVRRKLQDKKGRTLIVIDELDRMDDDDGLSLLADTLKTLSDHSVTSTLMLVGVADSLLALVGEHGSVVRSLVQVQMPRMSRREAESIIAKGMLRAELSISDEARDRVVMLSEGLPHYVHLMAAAAAWRAVTDDRQHVDLKDVEDSMEKAVDTHSIREEYFRATRSPQPGNLYEEVLLACAFAPRDDLGYFRPSDVKEPLTLLVNREVGVPNFQRHLAELSGPKRANALQKRGEPRNYRYRFQNPLLQPYAKIRALAKGRISNDLRKQLEAIRGAESLREDSDGQWHLPLPPPAE